jgi:hypothetical protein
MFKKLYTLIIKNNLFIIKKSVNISINLFLYNYLKTFYIIFFNKNFKYIN